MRIQRERLYKLQLASAVAAQQIPALADQRRCGIAVRAAYVDQQ